MNAPLGMYLRVWDEEGIGSVEGTVDMLMLQGIILVSSSDKWTSGERLAASHPPR